MEFDDCPHREKNGWTGDAQLAMEAGLWNYDAKDSYVHFLRMMLDAQRPNGAVPCILPCPPKFGFFWGSGPAWDAILFEIPWQLYRFYDSFIATHNTSFGEIEVNENEPDLWALEKTMEAKVKRRGCNEEKNRPGANATATDANVITQLGNGV